MMCPCMDNTHTKDLAFAFAFAFAFDFFRMAWLTPTLVSHLFARFFFFLFPFDIDILL